MPKTSITVSPETLQLATKVRGFRQYEEARKIGLDEMLNMVLGEEIQRIEKKLGK